MNLSSNLNPINREVNSLASRTKESVENLNNQVWIAEEEKNCNQNVYTGGPADDEPEQGEDGAGDGVDQEVVHHRARQRRLPQRQQQCQD